MADISRFLFPNPKAQKFARAKLRKDSRLRENKKVLEIMLDEREYTITGEANDYVSNEEIMKDMNAIANLCPDHATKDVLSTLRKMIAAKTGKSQIVCENYPFIFGLKKTPARVWGKREKIFVEDLPFREGPYISHDGFSDDLSEPFDCEKLKKICDFICENYHASKNMIRVNDIRLQIADVLKVHISYGEMVSAFLLLVGGVDAVMDPEHYEEMKIGIYKNAKI